ncbi:MAG: 4Fe-4S dicluster protein [Candidatus Poribacteria bacterium]|nr:4Fe-4S dicluster protein [Candidatus Poribacteria bacterium]
MKTVCMSKSNLEVSELCFGTLTLGTFQANLTTEEGAKAISIALEMGVNFIDTAQRYGTYPHVRKALDGWTGDVIIASKSHERTYEDMRIAVEEALREMNLDRIGIFHLHLIRSKQDFLERQETLECLINLREKGIIQAIGISAHSAEGVNAILDCDDIDVVFPIINKKGFGIVSGTLDDMLQAVRSAKAKGKDLYAMKPLGGGHLIEEIPDAINYLRELNLFDSISVGMKTPDEVEMNVRIFEDGYVPEELAQRVKSKGKRLIVYDMCKKCGKCEETCDQDAIKVGEKKSVVDHDKCILCGYCAAVCPVFALRVI